jgi:hypothetical protein
MSWASFFVALGVTAALQWWVWTRHPVAPGEVGNHERIITYEITKYSVLGVCGVVLLSAVPGVALIWLAGALSGVSFEENATWVVLVLVDLTTLPPWLLIRWANLRGQNPMG